MLNNPKTLSLLKELEEVVKKLPKKKQDEYRKL